jgi:hypothetical protein
MAPTEDDGPGRCGSRERANRTYRDGPTHSDVGIGNCRDVTQGDEASCREVSWCGDGPNDVNVPNLRARGIQLHEL